MVIYGHRGAAGDAAENTLTGIGTALDMGITRVEVDLQLSADGEIMVNHDGSLLRNRGTPGQLSSLSAAAIIAATANSAYPTPTLLKLLRSFPELEHLQLEIKPAPARSLERLANRLAEIIRLVDWPMDRLCATSSSERALSAVARAVPSMGRGLVIMEYNGFSRLRYLGCSMACVEHRLLNRWLINRLKRQRVTVSAWTVNDPSQMLRLRALGCDSIITDYPQRARHVLCQ